MSIPVGVFLSAFRLHKTSFSFVEIYSPETFERKKEGINSDRENVTNTRTHGTGGLNDSGGQVQSRPVTDCLARAYLYTHTLTMIDGGVTNALEKEESDEQCEPIDKWIFASGPIIGRLRKRVLKHEGFLGQ